MKVVLFNGSLTMQTFIQTLAESIKDTNQVMIWGFGRADRNSKLCGFNWISLGNTYSVPRLMLRSFVLFLKALVASPQNCYRGLRFFIKGPKTKKRLLEFNVFNAVVAFRPAVVHIQWAANIDLFRFLFQSGMKNRPGILVSFRGRLINIAPLADPKLALTYRTLFPLVDGFHAVSRDIAMAAVNWGAPLSKTKVIYSSVQTKLIKKHKLSWEFGNPIRILSVGRNHWLKGYNYALDGIRQLVDRGYPIKYTIVSKEVNEEIIYQIDDLGLTDIVNIIKGLHQSDVFDYMVSQDLLLLPSVGEGVANVVLEAMAIGLPVVVSDCGGMPEILEHNREGYLFRNRDVVDMVRVIESCLNATPGQRKKMAAAAAGRIERDHKIERLGQEMLEYYGKIQLIRANNG